MTTRVNVTMPDELAVLVRETMPGLNLSGLLQETLQRLVECPHAVLTCACCGARTARAELVAIALGSFYREVIWQLQEPISRCATAEGAARVVQSIARSWEVPDVDRTPLPRSTRSQRARVHAELVAEAEAEIAEQFTSGVKPKRRSA